MIKKPLLIYLHGLNSSPQSLKAQQTLQFITDQKLDIDFWAPSLPNVPRLIQHLLLKRLGDEKVSRPIYIFGSSLGGYIGTWLYDTTLSLFPHHTVKLVLINPAVRPYELFDDYLGPQENEYTGEKWELTVEYVEQIKQLEIECIDFPKNILLLAQTDDEVLDYRKAQEKYSTAVQLIQEGGNHSFEHFEKVLPMIFEFLSDSSASKYLRE